MLAFSIDYYGVLFRATQSVGLFCTYKKEMTTNSIYMDELLSELFQLNHGAIGEIHDSEPNGISLPKLSISDEIITKLTERWNTGIAYPKRGLYRNYVEQTIVRYAQDRQGWKKKFGLDQ